MLKGSTQSMMGIKPNFSVARKTSLAPNFIIKEENELEKNSGRDSDERRKSKIKSSLKKTVSQDENLISFGR